jgi:hypothetical protein
MIPEYQEPKGLAPDAEPLEDNYAATRHSDATKGSHALLNAMLLAAGKPPAPMPRPPCCHSCGAPLLGDGRLISGIQTVVASHYRIPVQEMVSDRKSRESARPRQVAMYLARKLTPKSLPEIGRRFGGRDHTTVMHAIRQVEKLIATDPDVADEVAALRMCLSAERVEITA